MCDGPNRPEGEDLARLRVRLEAESTDGLKLLESLKDNPICSISYDAQVPCIVVVWKRYATSTQLRFIHESIKDLLEAHGVTKILGDDTAIPTIHAADQAWIAENWMPRAIRAGLRAIASKSPTSYFGKLSISSIQAVAPGNLVFRSFDAMDDARRWLLSFSS